MRTQHDIEDYKEAFARLRAELSRSLVLLEKYHFVQLVSLTESAGRIIKGDEGSTKVTTKITNDDVPIGPGNRCFNYPA